MALTKKDGVINASDVMSEMRHAGTVTNRQIQSGSVTGRKVTSIIDDSSPDILYGTTNGTTASFSTSSSDIYNLGGTGTVIGGLFQNGVEYSAAQYHFTGSSIGVFARTNPWSGDMFVYIDGVLTQGKLAITTTLNPDNPGLPAVYAADTTITANSATTASLASFPAGGGKIQLGDERMTYTAITGGAFTGITRGVDGTKVVDHYSDETIYLVDSVIDLSTATDWGSRRLVYFNNLLPTGPHKITIVARKSAISGYSRIFFDGFLEGSIIGSKNIFTQFNTISFQFTTSANGHAELGEISAFTNDISLLSVVGYTDPLCEGDNTRILGKLGLKYPTAYDTVHDGAPDSEPRLYYHNGPVSTAVTLVVTFAYIGESV